MTTAQPMQQPLGGGHPAPERARVSSPALWFGLFGGPVAWSLQTIVNLAVAAHGCFPQLEPIASPVTPIRGIAFAVSVLAVIVCVAATAVAARSWARTRHEQHEAAGTGGAHAPAAALMETGEGRTRFMALAGVLTSATFLVVSALHAAAVFIVLPCAAP
jgi:hypothetical protein